MNIYKEFDLTDPQMRVVKMMEDGWALLWSNEPSDWRCRIVRGDRYFSIHVSTVNILVEKGIIKQDNAIPLGTFHFVDAE